MMMPVDISSIREEDRADFEKRLSTYGLTTTSILANELTTVASSVTQLRSGSGVESAFRPITLKTSDFNQVNKWIGIPDDVFTKIDSLVSVPQPLRFPDMDFRQGMAELPLTDALAKLSVSDLSAERLSTIRNAAAAYLYGDSRAVSAFKPWIEKVFPVIEIPIWAFFSVTVKSGSVLEFGPGPHVLVAYNLTIEEGGIIRSFGNLKVDVTVLQKTQPFAAAGNFTLPPNTKFGVTARSNATYQQDITVLVDGAVAATFTGVGGLNNDDLGDKVINSGNGNIVVQVKVNGKDSDIVSAQVILENKLNFGLVGSEDWNDSDYNDAIVILNWPVGA